MGNAQRFVRRDTAHSTSRTIKLTVTAAIASGAITLTGFGVNFSPVKDLGHPSATPNPFAYHKLFVDPASNARLQADQWRSSRPHDAQAMDRIARQPKATWIGDWNPNVKAAVDHTVTRAQRVGALPVLVAYNIPGRDCGLHSAGGAKHEQAYARWIREFAAGLKGRPAVVVLEPDAIAAQCLSGPAEIQRFKQIRDAVGELKQAGAAVYIDAGNPAWHKPHVIADRLRRAGIDQATGFALNVSNFYTTTENVSYGEKIASLVGAKHFIVDTSRNGNGAVGGDQWCNPQGRALGQNPTVETGHEQVDAFLWIKTPGESDGACNGAPAAGQWWVDYALGLARRQNAAHASN